ncbi:hypothetical protein ACH5RR_015976 [Cinchona calisaya]|uniref:Uncharacterized protein n=1 Tax=Cinchona calisaya TaxID=153742 RepID=A0ABD2ZYA5_9GENT
MSKRVTIGENAQIPIEGSSSEKILSLIKDSKRPLGKVTVMAVEVESDGREKLTKEQWKIAQEKVSTLMAKVESFNARLSQQEKKHVQLQQTAMPQLSMYPGGNR